MLLQICAKCADLCHVVLSDDKGEIVSSDGYVPKFMPGQHYGDYVILKIDPKTGQILNWRKDLTEEQMIEDIEAQN